jgi:hypothetical protein
LLGSINIYKYGLSFPSNADEYFPNYQPIGKGRITGRGSESKEGMEADLKS